MPKKKTVPRNPDGRTRIRNIILRLAKESPRTLAAKAGGFTGEEMLRALEVKAAACDESRRWTGKVDAETREVLRAIEKYERETTARAKARATTAEDWHLQPVIHANTAVASVCVGDQANAPGWSYDLPLDSQLFAVSYSLAYADPRTMQVSSVEDNPRRFIESDLRHKVNQQLFEDEDNTADPDEDWLFR